MNCPSNSFYFQGPLFDVVVADDIVWTIEDAPKPEPGEEKPDFRLLHVVLTKLGAGRLGPKMGQGSGGEGLWNSILKGDGECYAASSLILHQMRQKIDLERFQIEVII